MARGDVVTWWGAMSSVSSYSTLRPASGVSICVTSATGSANMSIGSNIGPGTSYWYISRHIPIGNTTTTYSEGNTTNMKIFSTNDIYTSIVSGTNGDTTWIASGIITKD